VPIVSVTPLGSNSGDAAGAIGQIIDYLQRGARRPEPNMSISAYYADTPTSTGVWRGRGVNGEQLSGPVDFEMFRQVLEGQHPHTGQTLVQSVGSTGRVNRSRSIAPTGPADEQLDVASAALWLAVDPSYVKKRALETERNPETKNPLVGKRDQGAEGGRRLRRDGVV
jgi:TrwC relaxase